MVGTTGEDVARHPDANRPIRRKKARNFAFNEASKDQIGIQTAAGASRGYT